MVFLIEIFQKDNFEKKKKKKKKKKKISRHQNGMKNYLVCNEFVFIFSKYLLEGPEQDSNYDPLPEERPGGFDWGQGERLGDEDRQ